MSIPVFLSRCELPWKVMTSAWWTMRSIIAAATTWSPKTSPQRVNARFLVSISDACLWRDETSHWVPCGYRSCLRSRARCLAFYWRYAPDAVASTAMITNKDPNTHA